MNTTHQKPIVIANWKLGLDYEESTVLLNKISNDQEELESVAHIILCPSATSLADAKKILGEDTKVEIGAQNMYFEERGAYTGENSILAIKQLGANYVIIGHSERRKYFNEKNEDVAKKTELALRHGIVPIICIGETYEERQSQRAELVVTEQLEAAIKAISFKDTHQIIIAYEPIWAIGTGQAINPEQAKLMAMVIHQKLIDMLPESVVATMRVIYGGSVDAENIAPFVDGRIISGVLVGGASQQFPAFRALVQALKQR